MSVEAIVMMVVAMLILWGGLAAAVVNLSRRPDADSDEPTDPGALHRDL